MAFEKQPGETNTKYSYQGAGNGWALMQPMCHSVYLTQLKALPISVALSNLIHLCHHPGPHAGPNLG